MNVVLLGGDLNAYAVAVSFHEAFGVRSTAFCRYRCGITATSSIVDVRIEPEILDDRVGVSVLLRYACDFSEKPYLIPCGDWYVAFLDRNRDALREKYKFLIPSHGVLNQVMEKADFYALLGKGGIPYPKTVVLSRKNLEISDLLSVGAYPAVLKPSNSTEYYAHPFEGMQKVYFPSTPKEALSIAERIYSAGYTGNLILQKRIGSESEPPTAKTLTLLFDENGIVRRGALGEILVEETEHGARGNYAAILSRPPDALTCCLIALLERVHYTGIANIDILTDKSGSYVLELNPRQGRSSDYLRACGISLASFLVHAMDGEKIETDLSSRVSAWHAVPLAFVMAAVCPEYKKLIKNLKKRGRTVYAFSYRGDTVTIKRRLYVKIHAVRRAVALGKQRRKA